MAPKGDGRLIVGATVEERGFDASNTAGGVFALLEAARRVLPSVEELAIDEIWTGFRPTSLDDAPILGEVGIDGLVVATGHHRNGILLAPVTARAISGLIADGRMDGPETAFTFQRFRKNSDRMSQGL
jgi:glycine oxidase